MPPSFLSPSVPTRQYQSWIRPPLVLPVAVVAVWGEETLRQL